MCTKTQTPPKAQKPLDILNNLSYGGFKSSGEKVNSAVTSPTVQLEQSTVRRGRQQRFGFPPKEGDIEIESLRTVIVALTQKLKASSATEREIESLKEQLLVSESSRIALQGQLTSLTGELVAHGENMKDEQLRMEQKTHTIQQICSQSQSENNQLRECLMSAQVVIQRQQAELNQLQAQSDHYKSKFEDAVPKVIEQPQTKKFEQILQER